jgi:uncharacterized repeat protein (TIGR03837 family)
MQTTRTWDIFCKVIDNFGDIGVCWRLCQGLAERGQAVRLWVDDASALAWMAPGGAPGVQVRAWTATAPAIGIDAPGDVVIEAFGCAVDGAWIAHNFVAAYVLPIMSTVRIDSENSPSATTAPGPARPPLWINLEYLSAEPYVARSHGLPSPVLSGPARGMTKWFFYPGFTAQTGGLLREQSLTQRLGAGAAPGPGLSPAQFPAAPPAQPRQISLFCYEPSALGQLLDQLAQTDQPTKLQVTAGRATHAVQSVIEHKNSLKPLWNKRKQLSITYQILMPQAQYDALLWRCDLNLVRGEDSLVRALWAGKPLVWHIYPQSDGAHADKLNAFLDWLQAPPDLRLFHHIWNGLSTQALPALHLPQWQAVALAARQRLLAQPDLVTQLLALVQQKSAKI